MSEISWILNKLKDTREAEILMQVESCYEKIGEKQNAWYKKSNFTCPEGCGTCCHGFEPDVLEAEALYMAAWLIENQRDVALKLCQGIFPFDNGKTCPFHNFENPYHCSVYKGRAFICRIFGASGSRAKDGSLVWRPCKFYPSEKLKEHNPTLEHRQYSQDEIEKIFGTLPPAMSDLMEQGVNISVENKRTALLREVLPQAVRRLFWIIQLGNGGDNDNDNGNDNAA
ncbi:YkgJ family cysteine cluster protein [Treponema pectinovorum]|uniref:YkgJ family cysteine cluster protein n=1 Tax=Treponema pectinovorum TaxID=164 RepID=UPI0011CBDBCF|nr:YkgJ family cysteine cluster protein [Treponema pectinovorum]